MPMHHVQLHAQNNPHRRLEAWSLRLEEGVTLTAIN
jgi:hypothetical protein